MAQAALRLLPGAAGRQLVPRDQLVLQPPQVGVLGRNLTRPQGCLYLPDRRRRLGQGARGRLVFPVDAVDASQGVTDLAYGVALEDVDRQAAALSLAQAV